MLFYTMMLDILTLFVSDYLSSLPAHSCTMNMTYTLNCFSFIYSALYLERLRFCSCCQLLPIIIVVGNLESLVVI